MSILIVTENDGDARLDVNIGDNLRVEASASRAFIDTHIGDGANGDTVSRWFLERSDAVEAAVKAKYEGGTAEAPFDQLTLKGLQ